MSYKELKSYHLGVHSSLTCSDCGAHPILGSASVRSTPPKLVLCQYCFSVRQPSDVALRGWQDVAVGPQPVDSDDEDDTHQTEAEAEAENAKREEAKNEEARVAPGLAALERQCVWGNSMRRLAHMP